MYIINTIPHGKCFVRYLRTRCFCIRNLTRSLRSLVRFLTRQQLVRKYRTPALTMKYSLFTYHRWRVTFLLDVSVSRYKRPLKIWDFVWEIKYWDLRTLNNVKSNFFFNEVNKRDLPAIYSTVFRYPLVVLLVSLALLHNHCYSLHKTKSRLVTSIWQCCWPVAAKMPFFRRNSSLLQIFSAATQEGNLLFPSKRSARKKLYNFPIKLNHLCPDFEARLAFVQCLWPLCAYQLICIMKISTYTTGARAEMTRLLGSCVKKLGSITSRCFRANEPGPCTDLLEKKMRFPSWVGAEKICSRLEFRQTDGIFVATGPGPCQIEWHSKHA